MISNEVKDFIQQSSIWSATMRFLYATGKVSIHDYCRLYHPDKVFVDNISDRDNNIAMLVCSTHDDSDAMDIIYSMEMNDSEMAENPSVLFRYRSAYLLHAFSEGWISESIFNRMVDTAGATLQEVDIKFYNDLLEKFRVELIGDVPDIIAYCESPSDELQILAVTIDPTLIEVIDFPCADALSIANGIDL